jgi:hypothetical protein
MRNAAMFDTGPQTGSQEDKLSSVGHSSVAQKELCDSYKLQLIT